MTYTISFAFILVVVSGLIAYLGDLIGRRMGKRRLTLMGLRPKHTAIVVTTITGMIIAAVTLVTILTVSSSLRKMFTQGEKLVRENDSYQAKNKALQLSNTKLTSASKKLTREVNEKSLQVNKAKEDAEIADKAREAASNRVVTLEKEIQSKLGELNELKRTGNLTKERLTEISKSLDARMKDLRTAKAVLAGKNKELVSKKQELTVKMAELADAQNKVDTAEVTIKRYEDRIQQQLQALVEQDKRLKNGLNVTDMLLRGDVVLRQGQEVCRKVIDNTQSASQVRAQLMELLDTASADASAAHAGENDGSRAIRIVMVDQQGRPGFLEESKCIDNAVDVIVQQGKNKQSHGVLVRAIVVINTLKGEKAATTLDFIWNDLAFSRGSRIASRTIDGGQSEGRILLSVMDFLKEDVRAGASKAGVVPIASPDPDDVATPISDVQLDDLMRLVNKIHSIGTPVEVRAVAQHDIYQAGPLDLNNIGFTISTMTASRQQ